MGLFGSIFGGSSESQSSTNKTTNVTTTTTSTVGDVGLTGQNAVDAIKALVSGFITGNQVQAAALESITQESGKNYQQLVGGANNLVNTAPSLTQAAVVPVANVQAGAQQFSQLLIPAVILGGLFLFNKMN